VDERVEDERGRVARRRRRTLRDALRFHPAGPEVLAALGALADRPLPDGWTRWSAAGLEAYVDAALDEAKARQAQRAAAAGPAPQPGPAAAPPSWTSPVMPSQE
jgi:hypothetical protein